MRWTAGLLSGLLPDRDMALAFGCEGFAVPVAPPLAQSHSGEPGHEVQLGWPGVADRCRKPFGIAVHEPVVDHAFCVATSISSKPRCAGLTSNGMTVSPGASRCPGDLDHE